VMDTLNTFGDGKRLDNENQSLIRLRRTLSSDFFKGPIRALFSFVGFGLFCGFEEALVLLRIVGLVFCFFGHIKTC